MAIKTLCALHKSRKPVNGIFNRLLAEHPLEDKDRQLATTIIYGVLRQQESLDVILRTLCKQPLKKFDIFIHQTLRTGLFQIFYLHRIPDSAAVNESVKAVQKGRLPKRLNGFVNGVLRNAVRRKDELLSRVNAPKTPILNHPEWLSKRWRNRYSSQEAIRICTLNGQQAAFTIQVNSSATDTATLADLLASQDIVCHRGEYCADTLVLDSFQGAVPALPGFPEGHFQVQDQGAQLLPTLLGEMQPGGRYLDACAGVGGKTSVMIQMAQHCDALVSAVEPDRLRGKRFQENMQRLHPAQKISLFAGTLQEFAASEPVQFNGILLDAPCSGTGVIRRHPDIRWNRREDDLINYQATQLELLHSAVDLLLPGGVLIYATCSLEYEENEKVIQLLLKERAELRQDSCASVLKDSAHSLLVDGNFAPLPGAEIDGFFGAKLRKQN